VRRFFGSVISTITKEEYYGSLEFKTEGIHVVFQEAPWVIPPEESVIPRSYIWLLFTCIGKAMKDTSNILVHYPMALHSAILRMRFFKNWETLSELAEAM
jgi:hypothetical protein